MTKKIRFGCFETNSSSTHSLSIKPDGWNKYDSDVFDKIDESPYETTLIQTFIKDPTSKTCVIQTRNYYKRNDTCFMLDTDMQKINFIVSDLQAYMGLFNTKLKPEHVPYIHQIRKAIHDYLREKYDISYIKVDDKYGCNYHDILWDIMDAADELTEEDVYHIIRNIISDDKYVFTAFSDECGPYPEDIKLIDVENLKDVINKNEPVEIDS